MKRTKTTRYLAIFMLALFAVIAIVMIVFGGYIFKYVILDKKFFFDLSAFSITVENTIRLATGWIGGIVFVGTGLNMLNNLFDL